VASAEIAGAVQRQLFHRGIDPRKLTLFAFGGTGPLHGAEVAEIVGNPRVIVPRAAGVFTTFGLLSSEIGMEALQHTRIFLTGDGADSAGNAIDGAGDAAEGADGDEVETIFTRLEAEVRQLLAGDRGPERVRVERTADMRFRHQVQTLPLNLPSHALSDRQLADVFRQEYTRQFGLTATDDVEVVQLRARGIATQDHRARSRAGQWSLRRPPTWSWSRAPRAWPRWPARR
jgi:N-methylhydantoinase A